MKIPDTGAFIREEYHGHRKLDKSSPFADAFAWMGVACFIVVMGAGIYTIVRAIWGLAHAS